MIDQKGRYRLGLIKEYEGDRGGVWSEDLITIGMLSAR